MDFAFLIAGSVVMILSFLSNGIFSEKMTSPTEVVSYDLFDSADSEPWLTPCGHVMPEALKNTTARTEIKDILKNVQLQLQSANAKYHTDINTVRDVYSQVRRRKCFARDRDSVINCSAAVGVKPRGQSPEGDSHVRTMATSGTVYSPTFRLQFASVTMCHAEI